MSIQAVAWVLSQPVEDLPVIPRAIMFSLANHADEESGYCWPSIAKIAKEAGVGERTVSRYLAALARNGYIEKRQKNTKGHFRSNDYWILFDRKSSKWQFFEPRNEGTEEPHATEADGPEADGSETRTPLEADGRAPLEADARDEPSESEPSESESMEGTAQPAESPPIPPPPGFARHKRQREVDRLQAADEARKPKSFPVIEGSEPWEAWMTQPDPRTGKIHSRTLTCTIKLENGRLDRGWYFPTLWPKLDAQAGPPALPPPYPPDPAFKRTG